jgi:transcriptional regulator with XRE-family HTH domain
MSKFKQKSIPPKAHPIVQAIFLEMNNQRITYVQLAEKSGVGFKMLERWRTGVSPQLQTLELVLSALDLTLVTMKEHHD